MSTSITYKGKGKTIPEGTDRGRISSSASVSGDANFASNSSVSGSESDLDSDSVSSEDESSSEEEITQEYLDLLLGKARQNAVASSSMERTIVSVTDEEEVIRLEEFQSSNSKEP